MPVTLPPRRLILFAGPHDWGTQTAQELISDSSLAADQLSWLDAEEPSRGLLGQDRALVVVDCFPGLNPDLIGRVSGLVRAGGALALICPDLETWPTYPDPELGKLTPYPGQDRPPSSNYLRRWVRLLHSMDAIEHYTPEKALSVPPIKACAPGHSPDTACTADQQQAVESIIRTATGKRRRPTVLRADRGRGKSAALGLAAGQLMAKGLARKIIVTAGGYRQAGNVFKHAQATLPDSRISDSRKCLDFDHGTLRYLAAETLSESPVECDLLIVDEASALGIARLTSLLEMYPRIAFSGTEHGYEGSGRGFALNFRKRLLKYSRGQYEVQLHAPVRWAGDDPLELWINHLLLLDIDTSVQTESVAVSLANLEFSSLQARELAQDETLLKQVFGLLIDAHYQTRPVDCRFLLDAPNAQLHISRFGEEIAGLIWSMDEGGLEPAIARCVVAGNRRPQGHLVPQVLGAHLGQEEALTLRCRRVQRIVVKPEFQGQGIGSWMLAHLETTSMTQIDYLASSFGVDLPLARFWARSGYTPVRVGDRARAASGQHSAVVLKALSPPAAQLVDQARTLFLPQLGAQLSRQLNRLDPCLVYELGREGPLQAVLNARQLKAAFLFALASRPYESSLEALIRIARFTLSGGAEEVAIPPAFRELLIARVLQLRTWSECARMLKLEGRQQCVALMRKGIRSLLEYHYPAEVLAALQADYCD